MTIAAASLAFILAGCSQNEIIEGSQNPDNAVNFGLYTPKTKGTVTDNSGTTTNTTSTATTGIRDTGFGILASYTEGKTFDEINGTTSTSTMDFMWNQLIDHKVTVTDGWGYTPLKYWPNQSSDMISFFAYAPYRVAEDAYIQVSNNTYKGYPQIKYSALGGLASAEGSDANLQSSPDLVVAQELNRERITDKTKVEFTFNHILTRVGMTAKLDHTLTSDLGNAGKTHVVITNIEIVGKALPVSGTYTYTANGKGDWSGLGYEDINLAGLINLSKVTIATTSADKANYEKNNAIEVTDGNVATNLFKGDGINETSEYLFLPPVNGGLAANVVTVKISYDIVTIDDALNLGYSITSAIAEVGLPEGILKKGMAYTLNFTIYMYKIEVDVDKIEVWDETDINQARDIHK